VASCQQHSPRQSRVQDASQRPLSSADLGSGLPYTLREQNSQACDAGSRQWTGWINVSEEKRLFFWFFESRSAPQDGPVMVWLNGGPGGPSMMGLFSEIGPTIRNEHSWSNFANVLFIDQPAGVGFSSVSGGTEGGPDNIAEASEGFDKFLSISFTDIFPQYSHLPFHIAGDQRQKLGVPGVFQIPIASIVLVNAVVDMTSSSYIGVSGSTRRPAASSKKLCRGARLSAASAWRRTTSTSAARPFAFCDEHIGVYLDVRVGGRVPYDDRVLYENGTLPLCGADSYADYLNRPHLQAALGLDEGWNFTSVNMDLNMRWEASGDSFTPSTREMSYILDETETSVLVINGNNDISVTTEGNKRVYDALPWSHQASFRLERYVDWEWPDKSGAAHKGGEFKAVDKLAFATFDDAGHEAVGHQKEAGAFLVTCWLSTARDGQAVSVPRSKNAQGPSLAQDVEL
ncbi:alpha/beta-hydrolase, partial [Apiospora aurea]